MPHIGSIRLKSPTVMAPIAGMTDSPFRRIVMNQGAGLTVSELLSANAIVRDSKKTFTMLPGVEEQKPVSVQIFGGDPAIVAESARIVESKGVCDIIDLNFGCPVKKVTKTGGGAAILKNIGVAEAMVKSVVSAVSLPVTVKMRIGWSANDMNGTQIAKIAEDNGAVAIAVHGRTAAQGYGGKADWNVIAKIAQNVKIPVIGNGDITSVETAIEAMKITPIIMIGRGALGHPWIFRQISQFLKDGRYENPSPEEIYKIVELHIKLMREKYGDSLTCRLFRSHAAYYSKGLFGAAHFREQINKTDNAEALLDICRDFFWNRVVVEGT